jgi:RimJ/RimL family protein N-acetyltransferase
VVTKIFPKKVSDSEGDLTLRLMEPDDRNSLLKLAQNLSEADLWFMRRDLTQPEAIDAWVNDIENNRAITLLMEDQGRIMAYGSLYHNQLPWNRHLAELRIMVTSPYRNRGIGAKLARELLMIAKDLEFDKVFSYTSVEDKGAQKMLEGVGFKAEALLGDWIKTSDDRTLDLVIMSASLAAFES